MAYKGLGLSCIFTKYEQPSATPRLPRSKRLGRPPIVHAKQFTGADHCGLAPALTTLRKLPIVQPARDWTRNNPKTSSSSRWVCVILFCLPYSHCSEITDRVIAQMNLPSRWSERVRLCENLLLTFRLCPQPRLPSSHSQAYPRAHRAAVLSTMSTAHAFHQPPRPLPPRPTTNVFAPTLD